MKISREGIPDPFRRPAAMHDHNYYVYIMSSLITARKIKLIESANPQWLDLSAE